MASGACLPKIDFSGVDPTDLGSAAWAAARQQVTEALTSLGCFEAVEYVFRFNKYGDEEEAQKERDRKAAGYEAHRDTNTLGIVCQLNGVDGLDVKSGEGGEWIRAKPSSAASFFIIAGDAFRAWSNGRVRAALHRINVREKKAIRYSTILFSGPKDEQVIQAPPELVDNSHPALFKPYTFGGFMRFEGSSESAKAECKLTAYCGVGGAMN